MSQRSRSFLSGPTPGLFEDGLGEDTQDPLSGLTNVMDVMLVFALGLLLALVQQSQQLSEHFQLDSKVEVKAGKELPRAPDSIRKALNDGGSDLESMGRVYRDPKTGKLILIGE